MAKGYAVLQGQWFEVDATHRHACTWCRKAQSIAEMHARNTNLKTVKATEKDGLGAPHAVFLTRLARGAVPPFAVGDTVSATWSGATLGVPKPLHTYKVEVCGNTYGPATWGHEGTMCNYSPGHWGKCGREEDGPEPVKPKRPVKLRLTEAEAVMILGLVKTEVDDKTLEADKSYQDGTGYEPNCVQAREDAATAARITKRLRKALGSVLDAEYGDED